MYDRQAEVGQIDRSVRKYGEESPNTQSVTRLPKRVANGDRPPRLKSGGEIGKVPQRQYYPPTLKLRGRKVKREGRYLISCQMLLFFLSSDRECMVNPL